jgi:glucose-1-phosphate cytidylyltransferase
MSNVAGVILAGGRGTRLGDSFGNIPKGLVPVGGIPIIDLIMNHLASYGIKDFYILAGYKSNLIRAHFYDLMQTSNVMLDFSQGVSRRFGKVKNWRIFVLDTGVHASTQSRIAQVKHFLLDYDSVLVTYSDCLSNVDINDLVRQNSTSEHDATVTAVQVTSKFGDLVISDQSVLKFAEKIKYDDQWINGGFIVFKSSSIHEIEDSPNMLEEDFLAKLAQRGKLGAYRHYGFWKSLDTPKDQIEFEELYINGKLELWNSNS